MHSPGVVMVLSNCEAPLGGTQKQAVSLAVELVSQGIPVSVVSKRQSVFKAARGGNLAAGPRREVTRGVRFFRLRASALQPAWSFLLSFLVWAGANRRDFQIIHAHNPPVGLIACVVARLLGKKVVIKVPGMKYVEYLTGSSAFRRLRGSILRRTDRFVAGIEAGLHVGRVLRVGQQAQRVPLEIGEVERVLMRLQCLISVDEQRAASKAGGIQSPRAPCSPLREHAVEL